MRKCFNWINLRPGLSEDIFMKSIEVDFRFYQLQEITAQTFIILNVQNRIVKFLFIINKKSKLVDFENAIIYTFGVDILPPLDKVSQLFTVLCPKLLQSVVSNIVLFDR